MAAIRGYWCIDCVLVSLRLDLTSLGLLGNVFEKFHTNGYYCCVVCWRGGVGGGSRSVFLSFVVVCPLDFHLLRCEGLDQLYFHGSKLGLSRAESKFRGQATKDIRMTVGGGWERFTRLVTESVEIIELSVDD